MNLFCVVTQLLYSIEQPLYQKGSLSLDTTKHFGLQAGLQLFLGQIKN